MALYQIMTNKNIGLVIFFRVLLGLIICPYLTALLVIAPSYIENNGFNFISFGILKITIYLSYTVVLIIGLPTTLYLAIKNKCSYQAFALTGFILGFSSSAIFFLRLQTAYLPHTNSVNNQSFAINDILSLTSTSLWFGFCAAVGATLFGYISSLPKWYNNAFKRDAKKRRAP